MYSSTVSKASVEPLEQKRCFVDELSNDDLPPLGREPNENFQDIFFLAFQKKEDSRKTKENLQKIKCEENLLLHKQEAIEKWFRQEKLKETQTFEDIKENKSIQEKSKEKCIGDFLKLPKPWYIPKSIDFRSLPFYKRYQCLPKFMMKLELGFRDQHEAIKMIENGINLFQINLKYGTQALHKQTLSCLKRANRIVDRKFQNNPKIVGIAAEITGRQLKVGLTKNNPEGIFLDRDTILVLTSKRKYSHQCDHQIIYVNFSNYIEFLKPNDVLKIGSHIKVRICRIHRNHSLFCIVVHEGLLLSKMHVTIPPERTFTSIEITQEEIDDIKFAINEGCDFIIFPCPLKLHACDYARWVMAKHKLKVIAKINSKQNLIKSDLDQIFKDFCGIYLTDSLPECNNYRDGSDDKRKSLRNYIIVASLWNNKILIRSDITEISSNQNNNDGKGKYEIYIKESVKNSFKEYFIYPDCLTIPQQKLKYIDYDILKFKSIMKRNYLNLNDDTLKLCCSSYLRKEKGIEHIFFRHLITTILIDRATCLIVISQTENATKFLSKYHPPIPIISVFKEIEIAKSNIIRKNVIPLLFYSPSLTNWIDELYEMTNYSVRFAYNRGYINDTEPFILVYDSKFKLECADTFKILTVQKMKDTFCGWINFEDHM